MTICFFCKKDKPCYETAGGMAACVDCVYEVSLTMKYIRPKDKEKYQGRDYAHLKPYPYPDIEAGRFKITLYGEKLPLCTTGRGWIKVDTEYLEDSTRFKFIKNLLKEEL